MALRRIRDRWAGDDPDVLADRDRIARDLHEHVIGRLFQIGMALHGTRQRATSPAAVTRLTDHIDQLDQVIERIRAAVFDPRTTPARAPGLRAELHRIIDDLTADTDLRTGTAMSGPTDLLPAGWPGTPARWSAKRSATPSGTRTPPR